MQNLVGVRPRKDTKENAHVKNVFYHFYYLPNTANIFHVVMVFF